MRILSRFTSLFAALVMFAGAALGQSGQPTRQCSSVSGTMATNLAVIDASTTLGTANGDLKGAVAAAIANVTTNSDGTVSFTVQHSFVTDAGDTIFFDPATAITKPLSETLFAILSYPVHIKGGTGKWAGATGDLHNIGEVDLKSGKTVFRYSGKVCLVQACNS
jgi:hypothetical protein